MIPSRHSSLLPLAATLALTCAVALNSPSNASASEPVEYLRDIKPLLQLRCYACHGALEQKSGLRVDTVELMLRGGDSGAIFERGSANGSLLLQRIAASDVESRMPPEHEGEAFTPEEVDTVRRWIEQGATGPADEQPELDPALHWAFQPLSRPDRPTVDDPVWNRHPVDAFLAKAHSQAGVTPQPPIDARGLIRRLYLDLIGVPPSAEQLETLADQPVDTWLEPLVNKLLDDPRHGQRWARHWMDIWRYSDSWGLGDQLRNSQKHIWHWRDWIVESLNDDLPYDEMIRQMLAADELYPDDLQKLRATGYLARNYFLFNRHQWMDETVEHVSKAFLGLTMNCAKCHDHKYDPLSQVDYYRMRAIFEPYHVRLDAVPGVADLNVDAVPRAFDGQLDTPTWLLIRGQENAPDKSQPLEPGVPQRLTAGRFDVQPVTLPVEAWQPERRPWVFESHRAALQTRLAAAEQALSAARAKLATERARAEQEQAASTAPASGTPDATEETHQAGTLAGEAAALLTAIPGALDDDFAEWNEQRWKFFGGDWETAPGRVEQRRDGAARSVMRLQDAAPSNFDATIRFTILGGSQWRSVCLGFDATQDDPSRDPAGSDSEQVVYVSGYAGGSKLQASYIRGGGWHYPADGTVPMPIPLNQELTLRVQVRDDLINASLDGKLVLAYRTPIARRDGALQLTTFDALAAFHHVSIAPLAQEVKLREPGMAEAHDPLAAAEADVQIAELAFAIETAEAASLEQRIAATQAAWEAHAAEDSAKSTADSTAGTESATEAAPSPAVAAAKTAAVAAVRAERSVAVARARRELAEAERRQRFGTIQQQASADKEIAAAKEKLDAATKQLDEPGEQFTRIAGAAWTPTRFYNSGQDDPAVTFAPVSSGRRTALARWIASGENPLTARVAVNHIWMRHVGSPLVPTVFDFGRKGTPPAHAELLDWLAAELIDSGWSMKHLHRLIVTSAAYRLDSTLRGAEPNLEIDPDNRLLWRRLPIRLEAEVLRDSVLALGGVLDDTAGGPSVAPAAQADSRRRSLYFYHSNNDRNLFLTTFDGPLVKDCYRREQSIVPQQALAMLNSRLVLSTAPLIAQSLSSVEATDAPDADPAFVRRAFVTVLGYEPSQAEMAASLSALTTWREQTAATPAAAHAYLVWALLNHNDFVTLR
jgi:hypothetical protein